ncbi:hypothetical protein BSL78_18943 [Apostichopus japonicus]|uniref:Uncharacterized protein n=1 Tax=Stichopus japonicus TaxID=307972 RepID=A0A2G8K864_STIJA|nr:hypothetical protein BSL78_18943 [Apostichopus japonicus]
MLCLSKGTKGGYHFHCVRCDRIFIRREYFESHISKCRVFHVHPEGGDSRVRGDVIRDSISGSDNQKCHQHHEKTPDDNGLESGHEDSSGDDREESNTDENVSQDDVDVSGGSDNQNCRESDDNMVDEEEADIDRDSNIGNSDDDDVFVDRRRCNFDSDSKYDSTCGREEDCERPVKEDVIFSGDEDGEYNGRFISDKHDSPIKTSKTVRKTHPRIKCTECGTQMLKSNVNRHMKTIHGINIKICGVCVDPVESIFLDRKGPVTLYRFFIGILSDFPGGIKTASFSFGSSSHSDKGPDLLSVEPFRCGIALS